MINSLDTEFEELKKIAGDVIALGENVGMTLDDFLQLCLDIRSNERDEPSLIGKNIIIPEKMLVQ